MTFGRFLVRHIMLSIGVVAMSGSGFLAPNPDWALIVVGSAMLAIYILTGENK